MKPSRARRRQGGQALVEWVIVLPVLLLMTFASLELGIYLHHQLVASGAAFLSARAAAVGGREGTSVVKGGQAVLEAYARESGQVWLHEAATGQGGKLTVTTGAQDESVAVQIVHPHGRWSSVVQAMSAATGGSLRADLGQIGARVLVNREHVPGKQGRSAAQSDAAEAVQYVAELGPVLGRLPDRLGPAMDKVRQAIGVIPGAPAKSTALLDALSLQPLQAVAENPVGRPFRPGRTLSAVYASSEAETLDVVPLGQARRLATALRTSSKAMVALRAEMKADPAFTPAVMLGLQSAMLPLAVAAKPVRTSLDQLDSALFGVRARSGR